MTHMEDIGIIKYVVNMIILQIAQLFPSCNKTHVKGPSISSKPIERSSMGMMLI